MDKKKSLGQNFLRFTETAKKIVDFADINSTSTVIEIGPGEGSLTNHIVNLEPKDLVLLELDNRLYLNLNEKFKNAKVINTDASKFNFTELIKNYDLSSNLLVIGNLPYNVSTLILENLINFKKHIDKMIFMFQKEVAQRITAPINSSEYGRLTLLAQEFYSVQKVMDLGPEQFVPAPKVDSSVLIFKRLDKVLVEIKNRKIYNDLLKILFSSRRKMLRRSLRTFIESNVLENLFIQCNIDPTLRPQNLNIHQIADIANFIS